MCDQPGEVLRPSAAWHASKVHARGAHLRKAFTASSTVIVSDHQASRTMVSPFPVAILHKTCTAAASPSTFSSSGPLHF